MWEVTCPIASVWWLWLLKLDSLLYLLVVLHQGCCKESFSPSLLYIRSVKCVSAWCLASASCQPLHSCLYKREAGVPNIPGLRSSGSSFLEEMAFPNLCFCPWIQLKGEVWWHGRFRWEILYGGLRDGSSPTGLGLGSQNPHAIHSHLWLQFQGIHPPSFGLHRHQALTRCTDIARRQNIRNN